MQGALLGLGAPLGWLVIRALAGYGFIEELTDDPALYVYLLVPTVLSFASFGVVLGIEGDRLLKRVAGTLASVARQGETAARVGGEEFALLLSGAAGENAYAAAERVRAAVAAVQFHPSHGAVTTITVSVGCASTGDIGPLWPRALRRSG